MPSDVPADRIAQRHFDGLLGVGMDRKYLGSSGHSAHHAIGPDGSTLMPAHADPARTPAPKLKLQDDPLPDLGAWKAERSASLDGDLAVIYRTEPSAQDGSYLWFGWWERSSETGIESFVGPTGAVELGPVDDIATAMGTATFAGHAAGRFGIYSPDDAGNGGGSFTARATLTADFGSAGKAGTISGTIDRSVAAGQARDWAVELRSTAILERRGNDVGRFSNGVQGTSWTITGAAVEGPQARAFGAARSEAPIPNRPARLRASSGESTPPTAKPARCWVRSAQLDKRDRRSQHGQAATAHLAMA